MAAECFLTFEAKALRECREALSGPGGVGDAYAYAEANPHPRLWRLVGEAALEKLELTVAEKALVQVRGLPPPLGVCEDYLDSARQEAQAARREEAGGRGGGAFGRFDDAEKLYRQMDRRDLALELRVRLGEWTKVVQLVQQGGGDDDLLTTAYNKIGDQFLERRAEEGLRAGEEASRTTRTALLPPRLRAGEELRGAPRVLREARGLCRLGEARRLAPRRPRAAGADRPAVRGGDGAGGGGRVHQGRRHQGGDRLVRRAKLLGRRRRARRGERQRPRSASGWASTRPS